MKKESLKGMNKYFEQGRVLGKIIVLIVDEVHIVDDPK